MSSARSPFIVHSGLSPEVVFAVGKEFVLLAHLVFALFASAGPFRYLKDPLQLLHSSEGCDVGVHNFFFPLVVHDAVILAVFPQLLFVYFRPPLFASLSHLINSPPAIMGSRMTSLALVLVHVSSLRVWKSFLLNAALSSSSFRSGSVLTDARQP